MAWSCDVTRRRSRAQTFRVSRKGVVEEISFVAFRRKWPSARLRVSVHRVKSGRPVRSALWRASLGAQEVSWSPRRFVLTPGKRLTAGRYAVVLSTRVKGSKGRCYGTVGSVASVGAGRAMARKRATTWRATPGDLGVWVSVR
jgi:hypothetical protein